MTPVDLAAMWAEEVEVYLAMQYHTDGYDNRHHEPMTSQLPPVETLPTNKFAGITGWMHSCKLPLPPASPHSRECVIRAAVRMAVESAFHYAITSEPPEHIYVAAGESDPIAFTLGMVII